ncbi:hypothetical protein QBC45DRAFT_416197 [Copromyces sp. CBS 386.78]|nr:hypothetical protein QBC45DRAFT_416197 [Copromyces sp. CBS 386.78]
MGRSGYMSGFYKGGDSVNLKKQLTQQKPSTSNDPTMPKTPAKPSKKSGKAPAKPSPPPRSSPGPSSSGRGRASQPPPSTSKFTWKQPSVAGSSGPRPAVQNNKPPPPPPAAKGKEKESHRFNPFARPVGPLSSVPRHLGGSIPAAQAVQQYLAQQDPVQQQQRREPPTSVPRNRWEFGSRPEDQQPLQPSSFRIAAPASDLGPQGPSTHHVVQVRDEAPGITVPRMPIHSFDWVCCFCHRNNNEATHPLQCTNPAL